MLGYGLIQLWCFRGDLGVQWGASKVEEEGELKGKKIANNVNGPPLEKSASQSMRSRTAMECKD